MGSRTSRLSAMTPILLATALGLGGAGPWAQAAPALWPGTDRVVHPFRPAVSPALAAAQPGQPLRTDASPGIGPLAAQQMAALQADKAARTPAQAKIDSQCLYTLRMLQGRPAAPGVAYLDTAVELDEDDALVLDLRAEVSQDLLDRLAAQGARVVERSPRDHSILATVPAAKVELIAGWPDIHFIGPRQQGRTQGKFKGRLAQAVQTTLQAASAAPNAFNGLDSEGDLAHGAALARGQFGVNGAGLKIGVLSDGVTSLALSQGLAALPASVTTLPGQAGSGDEGTAMLEIIYDLAPGATLYFATADNSITSFAANIRALRAAGCDIIVDDVYYYVETPFQDGQTSAVVSTSQGGVVSQAIKDVVAAGALYFTSAGNDGNKDVGTSGDYEGDFAGLAAAAPLPTGKVHDFGGGVGYDTITGPGQQVVGLWWADPLGASSNDYDLYLLNSSGSAVLASSTNIQNGTQDPVELIGSANVAASNRLVVFQHAGAADRYFNLHVFRGGLAVNTPGVIAGHSGCSAAITLGATPAATPAGLPTLAGPYPGPFTAAAQTEYFSSDGPRRVFFNGDSTAITPADFTHTGGLLLDKPDFTAADGVTVSGVGGFASPFYGTSASAPHAAAIAALVKSGAPGASNTTVMTALQATAIDILGTGWDRDSGHGILMPVPALAALGAHAYANPVISAAAAAENPGNGDGFLEIGEGGKLTLTLTDSTAAVALTGITATLTAVTSGVTVAQPAAVAYPDLAGGGSASNATPFRFTVGPAVDPGTTALEFVLTVQGAGMPAASTELPFTVPFGLQNTVTTTLAGTPSRLPAGVSFATGTQAGRINRNGVISACASPKSFPGTIAGNHGYDAYTFTPATSACATVLVSSASAGANLFSAAYAPFTPGTISTGYLGDAGLSSNVQAFTVDLVAGTACTLVINDVAGNTGANPYTLRLPVLPASFNRPPVALARDITLVAGADGTAAGSIDNGSSDPDGGAITLSQFPAGPYPAGVTPVILTATDALGAMGQASANVTVTTGTSVTLGADHGGHAHVGQTMTLTATVAGGGAVPATGNVVFRDGGTDLATVALAAGGASCTTSSLALGPHSLSASYAGDSYHAASTGSLDLTVAPPAVAIAANPPSVTAGAGAPGTTQLTLSGLGTLGGPITFAVTGLPAGATCTFDNDSVDASGGPVVVTATLAVAARSASLRPDPDQGPFRWGTGALLGCGILALPLARRRRRFGLFLSLLALVGGMVACGGGGGGGGGSTVTGTPAGSYTVTITASSAGATAAAASLALTVD